jgi:membrane-associated phospholipid phosphatase
MHKNTIIYFSGFALIWLSALAASLAFPKETLSVFLGQHRTDFLNIFFQFSTKLGEWVPFVLIALFLIFKKEWRNLLSFGAVIGGAILMANTLKDYFSRPRPVLYMIYNHKPNETLGYIEGSTFLSGDNSFPSGHTLAAFAVYTAVFFYFKNKKMAFLWLAPALLVGFSRVYLGHHFLEDVTFGAILGVVWAFLVEQLRQSNFLNSNTV